MREIIEKGNLDRKCCGKFMVPLLNESFFCVECGRLIKLKAPSIVNFSDVDGSIITKEVKK